MVKNEIHPCGLCNKKSVLCKSHIIPKFVFQWIKKTSATGKLRLLKDPNRLTQDGLKEKLLCRECEDKFNVWETKFANEIFWPYLNGDKSEFSYSEWLTKFIVSLNWRLITNRLGADSKLSDSMKADLKVAEFRFRKYLLDERSDPGHYQNNLVFVDFIESSSFSVPSGLTRYLGRAIDATVVYSGKKELWIYIKMGKIISITLIKAQNLMGWKDSRIQRGNGVLNSKQRISSQVGAWFIKRNEEITKGMQSYEGRNRKAFWEKVKRNPDNFIASETFRSYIEEERMTGKFPTF